MAARFSILVNGSLVGFFTSSSSLRQTDLLSLLLFVIVMEVLSEMMFAVVDNGFMAGFSFGDTNWDTL